ncbi:restriction endonuclease subunit S [Hymenobacter sp. CRA2]|uniref:restriction endonuclease subunit S n=1 Tax=Hymenobacter sp. CRA2 TaxID=1955620 RepID=UPI00098F3857|nr:restriction endonuclease subunit S [Hymenobacter sp. CRA2]OON68315.1 hypothetical protein B0919_14285 [Hymenobacter sp. CRA2]
MQHWKQVRLGDILTESAVPAINSSNERRITVRLNVKGVEKRPVGSDKEGATKYFIRSAGQFIYGRQNLHKGAFGIIPSELDGYESSQDLPAFDVSPECLPEWLLYFFRQGNFYQSLDRIARGIGSRRINPRDLLEIEMPLPEIEEQKQLLAELKATDEAVEELEEEFTTQAALLTQLRQAILREAVQGKLVPQDPADEPAAALLTRIRAEKERLIKEKKLRKEKPLELLTEAEKPYELPQGWEWVRIEEVCSSITDCVNKTAPLSQSITPFKMLRTTNIRNGKVDTMNVRYVSEETYLKWTARDKPCKGDLILTREAPLGEVGLIEQDDTIFLGQRLVQYRADEQLLSKNFLFHVFRGPIMQNQIKQLGVGMTVKHLRVPDSKVLSFPLPPLAEQHRIVAKVTELLSHCDALEAELTQARQAAEALHAAALREAFAPRPVAEPVVEA